MKDIKVITLTVHTQDLKDNNPEQFIVDADRANEFSKRLQLMRMDNGSLLVSHWDDKYVSKSSKEFTSRSLSRLIVGKSRVRRVSKNSQDITSAAYAVKKPIKLTVSDKLEWLTTDNRMAGISDKRRGTIVGIAAFYGECKDLSKPQTKMVDDIYSQLRPIGSSDHIIDHIRGK